jgi:hypothetical protein
MFLATLAGISPAAEQSKKTETRPTGMFQVNVSDGYLSLNADDAPLAQIFREIARQARITIDSNIGPEEKITTRLERVPLEDGIKRLAKNVSVFYAQDEKTNTRRIARVVVLSDAKAPTGQTKASPQPEKVNEPAPKPAKVDRPRQPEPFKFQFDPTKSAEKETARKQP